jgi:4-hydroxythreonine-4-phosphate dehydrogenase
MSLRLALVAGEPGGVGPELCVRLAQRAQPGELVAIADPDTLQAAAARLGLPLRLREPGESAGAGELALIPRRQSAPVRFGHADPANARFVIDTLLEAGRGCLSGEFDGVVTGPVHKASVNAGGIAYTGTTELLAHQAGVEVVMMLATPGLRVALATTHLALREVPDAITRESLARVLRILHAALRRDFGIESPRIVVLGLNPHAGEDGVLGSEEIEVIRPVLEALRAEGFALEGPLPADTAFLPHVLRGCDAVLAMFHDQGLPVLKHAAFGTAVNVTLGLPIIRTSVDHGTALDLAGAGDIDPGSLEQAIALAFEMAARSR